MNTPSKDGKKLSDPVLQIKKFKHWASMSEETEAFSGELYLDGELLAPVKNDGQGGCHHIQAYGAEAQRAVAALSATCKAMPNVTCSGFEDGLEFDLDLAISILVGEMVKRKDLKRILRNKIGVRQAGKTYEPGVFDVVRLIDTPENRKRVAAKAPIREWLNDEANTPVYLRLSEIHELANKEEDVPA